jgi:endoglucanase
MSGFVASLLLLVSTAPPSAVTDPQEPTVISVDGERLVDQNGQSIQLRGVNRSSAEYACVQGLGLFEGPTDDAAVVAMRSWGANAVRVPLNEDCWLGAPGLDANHSGAIYRSAIVEYADLLAAAGMVVILDLHWTGQEGHVALEQQPMPGRSRSPEFWRSVATEFRERSWVVFDVFNEPHDVSWECWRDGCGDYAGMQDLVDAVRSVGATQPIVLSGLDWGGDLREWLEHRPDDPAGALVAGVHLYDSKRCVTPTCWDEEIGAIAAEAPVVITEFGDTNCTGEFSATLMAWADQFRVSYLAWAWNPWDCDSGPAVIKSFDGEPTAFGEVVRQHLISRLFPEDLTFMLLGGGAVLV